MKFRMGMGPMGGWEAAQAGMGGYQTTNYRRPLDTRFLPTAERFALGQFQQRRRDLSCLGNFESVQGEESQMASLQAMQYAGQLNQPSLFSLPVVEQPPVQVLELQEAPARTMENIRFPTGEESAPISTFRSPAPPPSSDDLDEMANAFEAMVRNKERETQEMMATEQARREQERRGIESQMAAILSEQEAEDQAYREAEASSFHPSTFILGAEERGSVPVTFRDGAYCPAYLCSPEEAERASADMEGSEWEVAPLDFKDETQLKVMNFIASRESCFIEIDDAGMPVLLNYPPEGCEGMWADLVEIAGGDNEAPDLAYFYLMHRDEYLQKSASIFKAFKEAETKAKESKMATLRAIVPTKTTQPAPVVEEKTNWLPLLFGVGGLYLLLK